jgi:hypothetical protein
MLPRRIEKSEESEGATEIKAVAVDVKDAKSKK